MLIPCVSHGAWIGSTCVAVMAPQACIIFHLDACCHPQSEFPHEPHLTILSDGEKDVTYPDLLAAILACNIHTDG